MKIYRRTTIVEEKEITISINAETAKIRRQYSESGAEKDDSHVLEVGPSTDRSQDTSSQNCLTDKTTEREK